MYLFLWCAELCQQEHFLWEKLVASVCSLGHGY